MERDVVVIGSGQAGVPLAARLAEAGRTVVLAERARLGGTCVNYGCTPTKTVIASARAAHEARTAHRLGVSTGEVTVDLGAVMRRKDRIVREWRDSVAHRIERAGSNLTLLRAHARFTGPGTVAVGDEEVEAPVVIINAGARPRIPPIDGLDSVPWMDNAALLELDELPDHLVVVGGGYVGCELGQAFHRLGARVTVIDSGDRLLSNEDPEISEALAGAFDAEGIDLRLGDGAASVGPADDGGVRVRFESGDEVRGSHLLVATGRRPNTDDLGADAAGVELDEGGAVIVDDRYRTSAEGVYAVGDVTGGPQFTHASWDDHRILFDLLNGDERRTRADRVVPYCVFTDPQVARVGLSESEARERGLDYEVASMPFENIARARETGRPAGVLKVLIDPATERVLGAALVGAEVGELIHVLALAVAAGIPARAIVDMEVVHPTFTEGVHSLIMKLERYAL